jgi:SAM-dependent methyltransferase
MDKNLFDLSGEYEEMLNQGIRLSGEDRSFFITGRIQDLKKHLPLNFKPRRILDFGCGIGDTTRFLADAFPGASIVGIDTAEEALEHARKIHCSPEISFCTLREFSETDSIDLCYVNGVFHHIEPPERPAAVKIIRTALAPGGFLALFENNPWNPGARMVMNRIPFDRDAQPLSPIETKRLLRQGGFNSCARSRSLFYFPRALALLRFAEPWLARLPLGAQYYILAWK